MKLVYIVFLISACSLSSAEQHYQIVNETGHTIRVRVRRTDIDRDTMTPNDILINEQVLRPDETVSLPETANKWVKDEIPLGMRIDHAGTAINQQSPEQQTPLIAGFHLQRDELMAKYLIIVYYTNQGKINIRTE